VSTDFGEEFLCCHRYSATYHLWHFGDVSYSVYPCHRAGSQASVRTSEGETSMWQLLAATLHHLQVDLHFPVSETKLSKSA
jgi:hypothetical protein